MSTLKKILLVDDDEDLREALGEQLVMTEDFDVFEAGDGHEAMEKVKAQHYDLVILDVGLAGYRRPRAVSADAQAGCEMSDPDADRP
jgi:DNA-binding response OmpR family regulator